MSHTLPLNRFCVRHPQQNSTAQEVSIDGTIVQRKSRPSWFGFLRRKDPSYELRVTKEGIEIYRRGKLDWVIKAEDIF